MKQTYKRMVRNFYQKEQSSNNITKEWLVYILECADGTFYTGITKDISRRLKQHLSGKASKYTRIRLPVKLLYLEEDLSHSQALIREYRVKALSKKKKMDLVHESKKQ